LGLWTEEIGLELLIGGIEYRAVDLDLVSGPVKQLICFMPF